MHGLRRRLSEPRMAGHLPADRSANQRVTSAGDSFLCILMCGTQHTYVQSKKQAKIAPVENSKRAGSTGLSWDLGYLAPSGTAGSPLDVLSSKHCANSTRRGCCAWADPPSHILKTGVLTCRRGR